MIQRQTWISCSDATNIKWARVFHLYRGFYCRQARIGRICRASARKITPPRPIYRSFKVKIYKKGDVFRLYFSRPRRHFTPHRPMFATKRRAAVVLKRQLLPRSKYFYGPVLRQTLTKKYELLFKFIS